MDCINSSCFDYNGFAGLFVILFMIFVGGASLGILVLRVWAFCRIFSKVGYSWAFGLLTVIPLVHFVVPIILGFSKWPLEKQLKELKEHNNQLNSEHNTNNP